MFIFVNLSLLKLARVYTMSCISNDLNISTTSTMSTMSTMSTIYLCQPNRPFTLQIQKLEWLQREGGSKEAELQDVELASQLKTLETSKRYSTVLDKKNQSVKIMGQI
jgi:hypothetical protein